MIVRYEGNERGVKRGLRPFPRVHLWIKRKGGVKYAGRKAVTAKRRAAKCLINVKTVVREEGEDGGGGAMEDQGRRRPSGKVIFKPLKECGGRKKGIRGKSLPKGKGRGGGGRRCTRILSG